MGIAESVLGGEEADFDAEFGEEGAWLGEDGEGSQAQSTPRTVVDADAEARQLPDRGLRVMSVEFGSPAATGRVVAFGSERAAALAGPHHRGLITFTDIILSANGVECGDDGEEFLRIVRAVVAETGSQQSVASQAAQRPGGSLDLEVLESLTNTLRIVRLRPGPWEGHGLLGITAEPAFVSDTDVDEDPDLAALDEAATSGGYALPVASRARLDVLRVDGVLPHGPAALARMSPAGDVILGADGAVFSGVEGFGDHLHAARGTVTTLHVFNERRCTVRDVPLFVTTRRWGVDGEHEGIGLVLSSGFVGRLAEPSSLPRVEWAVLPQRAVRRGPGAPQTETKPRRHGPTETLVRGMAATAPSSGPQTRLAGADQWGDDWQEEDGSPGVTRTLWSSTSPAEAAVTARDEPSRQSDGDTPQKTDASAGGPIRAVEAGEPSQEADAELLSGSATDLWHSLDTVEAREASLANAHGEGQWRSGDAPFAEPEV
ncbi:hypothetical protein FNF29_04505 [Cafeteria roenbergensis]|uniref:PDZ GRASP-type domain-containing protein n=1 Tax=Cafeteria roenbergensis TaxID=33653 RepID=A0A5A8CID0_CAFRO|nr:hypothetical protein FNF29_04505 [Cafeteria roenbergensis]|eukprot:KAA0151581.1 hypothetical protein FNF29_04505 [Cafeteria roenbergensis]